MDNRFTKIPNESDCVVYSTGPRPKDIHIERLYCADEGCPKYLMGVLNEGIFKDEAGNEYNVMEGEEWVCESHAPPPSDDIDDLVGWFETVIHSSEIPKRYLKND